MTNDLKFLGILTISFLVVTRIDFVTLAVSAKFSISFSSTDSFILIGVGENKCECEEFILIYVGEDEVEDFCEWWLNLDGSTCADDCGEYVWEGLDEITDGCLEILTPDCMMDCPDDNLEVLWEFALLDEEDQDEELVARIKDSVVSNKIKSLSPKNGASIAAMTDRFTIQITSKKMLKDAQLFSQKLINQGYDSYIQKVVFNSDEIWYRVRVGSYDNYNSAKVAANDLSDKLKMNTWVDFVRKEQ